MFYLFKIKKGLSNKEAASLIGVHFPSIDDKLYNLLELGQVGESSELLLASIEQKSRNLNDFAFVKAVKLKESWSYLKYLLVPVGIVVLVWISGNIASFFGSYNRVVNYDLAYEQPAPFEFRVLNEKLEVLDNEKLVIEVETVGDVRPENIFIVIDGEELLLQKRGGVFTHSIEAPVGENSFFLTANGWDSRVYLIRSFSTPSLEDFRLNLTYPNYTLRSPEEIIGTGNAVVPEGTEITWKVIGRHVDEIVMDMSDTVVTFKKNEDYFNNNMKVYNSLSYELKSSNSNVRDFEVLGYQVEVIKDAYPLVEVEQILDSINPNQTFFVGQASDDYKVNEIRAVCFPSDDAQDVQRIVLESPKNNVHQFYYTFPSGFKLKEGKSYSLFFEVVDNDEIRGGKVKKSKVFKTALLDDNQLKNKELDFQNSALKNWDRSLSKYKEQSERLSEINQKQKNEANLNFEEQNEIKDFLKKQELQEQLMQKFSKQLNKSLDKDGLSDERKKMLKERLERQELEAKKNEKLLEELNKLSDKIDKDELKKKLEEIEKNQRNATRNLEQILELTKRYYVTEKMTHLAEELDKLSEKQRQLSEMELGDKLDEKLQEELSKEFDNLSGEIDSLRKDNKALKKPLDFDITPGEQRAVKQDQRDAEEEINKHQGNQESSDGEEKERAGNRISQKQKAAAQKMKEMSNSLSETSMSGGGSSVTEDAEMLRQILDNLVTFSFKQEGLFENVENSDIEISQFSKMVKDQKELRGLFEHVDDSLFSLSLRRAELSEFVNEQITEVYYNIDKALESIADNQVFRGASHQQYIINATNALADFLANILDNMQESMSSGKGNGQGKGGFQLPDIIQGQKGIQEGMNNAGKSGEGKEGKKGNGEEGGNAMGNKQQGDGQGEGNRGQKGESLGQSGQGGLNGPDGEEMGLNEIYEIYKEQQFLRKQLEEQLKDMINEGERNLAEKLVRQIEDFENDLLQNGITQRTINKVNTIQHQLMKLENASLKQGKESKRESNTNDNKFQNPVITKPEILEYHNNNVEILNRQALPLRQDYDKKVKVYFKND